MSRIATLVSAALVAALFAAGALARPAAMTHHLVIQHVEKGCHVWNHEGRVSTSLRLELTPGARLHIVNRDVVAQQLVQLSGPNLALRGHMMPGKSQLIAFSQPGVYRFTSKVIAMGAPTKMTTVGPDNVLRLTVSIG